MAKIENPNQSPGQPDFYFENGFLVFTKSYHEKRGFCCGNGCRHCPYTPKHCKGTRDIDKSESKQE
jgi:hypothetical protein